MKPANCQHCTLFVRLPVGEAFLYEGRFYQKVKPVPSSENMINAIDEKGAGAFIMARWPVWPVTFEEVRTHGGKLLFKYAAEFGLIEIKPKGEERPLLVKLMEV